ncbi:tumor protein p53-inducible protein 13 [Paramisgurnus dabryanus]|uniref:tumor protein p53-inducible protein 13 n=1 Tax=Paramisgurnus dabryanus TaxID=90735 RepID=UPI0031F45353
MNPRVSLISGLIWIGVIQCCHSRLTLDCDNGKANLDTDLPASEELMCQKLWPQSQMNIPDIDTKYPIQASDYICMDTPITYNDTIPTHGPYRPVEAESGEYLYCPPQRWLHNLKSGALVLLYHPCVSTEARRSLAVLARSCLAHYILTPYPWLSQHRPLALVSWGRSLETSRITPGVCDWLVSISYNISQTSTSQGTKYNLFLTKPAPVDRLMDINEEMSSLEGLKSLKNCCSEALNLEVRRTRGRSRKTRMALKQTSQEVKPSKLNSTDYAQQNITDTLSENNKTVMNLPSHNSSTELGEPSRGAKVEEMTEAEKQFAQSNLNEGSKNQIYRKTHKNTTVERTRHRIKTDTKAQRFGSECEDLGLCETPESPGIEGLSKGQRIKIPRSDEAMWAAAALGFLLVLLTLSVLHTRLYRHCRSSTSLYWQDNKQDFENVGDIIRRRLRMVGRRKRRGNYNRRKECALLSNSSNEENSD